VGTWDKGPFDNDEAADWCGELNDAPPGERVAMIRAALAEAADRDDYLDADVAARAIAAAAVLAAQRPGGPPTDSVYGPGFLAEGVVLDLPGDLPALAVRAIDRVTGDDSEWRELWSDAGAYDEAISVLKPLRTALDN